MVGVGVWDKTKVSLPRADAQHQHERGGRTAQRRGEGEEGGETVGAVEEVAVGGAEVARGVGGPPVRLVNEDGAEVDDNLGGAEREAITGQSDSSRWGLWRRPLRAGTSP